MATETIEFKYTSLLTLTAVCYPQGNDTAIHAAANCTEATNRKGIYTFTNTTGETGLHDVIVLSGSTPVLSCVVRLTGLAVTTREEIGKISAYYGDTPQTADNNVILSNATYGNAALKTAIEAVNTAVTAGVAASLTATADRYVTDASANRVNSYTATFLSNGTNWITGPTTPAVAEAGASGATAGSPFWLNVGLLFVAGSNQYINSVTIRGFFSAGSARNVNVYAYNYVTKTQDQLSDATTRMATATTNQTYTYTLLSAHQKSTAAVATTSAGSNFVGVTTTCTASVTGHGFVTGDIVTISGITTLTNANGVFVVTRVNDNQFTYPILSQTATGGGTAYMTTDAIGSVRIVFKEGTTSTYTAGDRLNIDQCIVNVASAGPSAADIAAAVKATSINQYYPEGIFIDTTGAGVAGTVPGTNGVRTNPVSTYADAMTLAGILNLRILHLKPGTTITLTQNHVGWRFVGGAINLGASNYSIEDCIFDNCYDVYGTSTGADAWFSGGGVAGGGTLTIDAGYMVGTLIRGKVQLIANAESHRFISCKDASGIAAECEISSVANCSALIRDFHGAVKLTNMAATSSAVIDGNCRVNIDPTSYASGASITLRGFADLPTNAAAFQSAGGVLTQTARFATDQNVGIDWANVSGKTSTVALTNTSINDVSTKTGFKLASDGLDTVSITAPAGVASNFREMLVAVWRRFFKRVTKDTTIKTYADNGSTVLTTQSVTEDVTEEVGSAT